MKLKAVLVALAIVLVGTACGKSRVEYVEGQQGPKGDKGDKGDEGDPGTGCTAIEVAVSAQYPNGGAAIMCGDTNIVLKNGAPGQPGTNGTDAIAQIIDPCGDAPGIYDEVILKLANGTLLASFSDKANGENTRFSVLTAGSYVTTDGSNCHFTVTANGAVQ